MKLETARLLIFPLSLQQLELYGQGNNLLEEELQLNKGDRLMSLELAEAFYASILPAVTDAANDYLYNTLWTIVSKKHNQMVADLCFKGSPNEQGEVELGYGTYDQFQGRGFMTEAIMAITEWAFQQATITTILAETEQSNIASEKILVKNNFVHFKTAENMKWWKLVKSVYA